MLLEIEVLSVQTVIINPNETYFIKNNSSKDACMQNHYISDSITDDENETLKMVFKILLEKKSITKNEYIQAIHNLMERNC